MRWVYVAMVAGACCVTTACPAATAQAVGNKEDNRMHVETTFEVLVRAPYDEAANLFSPEGERAWAGAHWDPTFVYPLPARDTQGAVFTISHGSMNAVWVVARRDLEARHFQYVYFIPDVMVTTIDVEFKPLDPNMTHVKVTYARTAVSAAGDDHVKAMSEGDQTAGKEWQQAVDRYLASQTPAPAR
jgi:hypothetical protein